MWIFQIPKSIVYIHSTMNAISNPSINSGLSCVGVDCVVAGAAKRGKHSVVAQQTMVTSSFVMDVLTFRFFATLASRIALKVGYANLGIGFVFLVALGGCGPQPAVAFSPSVNFLTWLLLFF